MEVYRPHYSSASEMSRFHSEDYIQFLERITPDNKESFLSQMQKCKWMSGYFFRLHFGCTTPVNIGEYTDCPVFDGMFEFCQVYTGASLGAFSFPLVPVFADVFWQMAPSSSITGLQTFASTGLAVCTTPKSPRLAVFVT
jgi:hypothetical protein